MWCSEVDFTKDLESIGEIWELKEQNGKRRQEEMEHKGPRRVVGKKGLSSGSGSGSGSGSASGRGRGQSQSQYLDLDSEDEEQLAEDGDDCLIDETDPLHVFNNLERQIIATTGNMNDNKLVTEYWQPQLKAKPVVNNNIKPKESSLVFESNICANNVKVNKEITNVPKIPTRTNKISIADAIKNSVKNIKPENIVPKTKSTPTYNFYEPRKVLSSDTNNVNEPNSRISLPIGQNCYKDYYSGNKLSDYQDLSDTLSYKSSSSDQYYMSSNSSTESSFVNNENHYVPFENQTKGILNINSELDFPPL